MRKSMKGWVCRTACIDRSLSAKETAQKKYDCLNIGQIGALNTTFFVTAHQRLPVAGISNPQPYHPMKIFVLVLQIIAYGLLSFYALLKINGA